ncbi:MAG TPA: penicillin acylase family protein, partial [Cyclobacteriaceae bacterium]|nr:penicillin acylase family protein [Cyclobacteriaceae bacterium]
MNKIRFVFSLILISGMVIALDSKIGDLPPLGKLFDPFHGFWQNAEAPGAIHFDSSLLLPGLTGKVVVKFEENLIPHIFASNDHDLYYVQGYITARYRLWQMDFLSLVASGRISEIIGPAAVNFDRLQRRKGLMYGAENSLKEFEKNENDYSLTLAYAEGVNAYIRSLEYKNYPVEYKILDYLPEKWTPLKTVLLLKYMADDLSGSDDDLENTNAEKLFGKERFDFLFPGITEENDPIIPVGTKWNFSPIGTIPSDTRTGTRDLIPRSLTDPEEGLGSNNWAVSGTKTLSGYPILCNDPHLRLTFPAIWYAQQLISPEINVYGVTIPGLPGVLLGFNDSVAWGLTNAPRDVRDWYSMSFRDEDRSEYLYNGKWLKTQKRIEKIGVRGGQDFIDTVIYTHYGPLVYDKTFLGDSGKMNFALKWTAHSASQEVSLVFRLNRLRSVDGMPDAVRNFECPPQNIAAADRSGNIGIFVEGNFPLRKKDQGRFLMDGSLAENEWKGFLPKEHNARIINPARGFISSANQRPFDDTYPYDYYNDSEEHFRNRRINTQLSAVINLTPEEMMKLQNDNYSVLAQEVLPVILDSVLLGDIGDEEKFIVDALRKWNFFYNPQLTAPSYFHTWFTFMERLTWDEFDVETPLPRPDEYQLSWMLRKFPGDSIFNIKSTEKSETYADIIRESLNLAADSIERWKEMQGGEPLWYRYKGTRIQHLVPQFRAFGKFNIETGGFEHIVNAATATHGPSWRLVVELA